MPLNIKVNRKNKEIKLIKDEKLIATFNQEETESLIRAFKSLEDHYGHVFIQKEYSVTLQDLKKAEKNSGSAVHSIEIRADKMMRFGNINVFLIWNFENEKDDYFDKNLEDEFEHGTLWFKGITNHQLRSLFHPDLLNHIKSNNISIVYANWLNSLYDEDITEELFDEKSFHTYELNENTDS